MSVFWCDKCFTPLLGTNCNICNNEGKRISSDIRPVFPEERRLFEILLNLEPGFLMDKVVWDTQNSCLIVDGDSLNFSKRKIIEIHDPFAVRESLSRFNVEPEHKQLFWNSIHTFVRANRQRLKEIELEAFDIIKKSKKGRDNYLSLVSFSGGKDSTVVSDLVRRAYATQSIIHIFGDTTLEIPETLDYLKRFRKANARIPFFESKSRHNFFDLCNQIGPPSRVMRWCCTVFKTGPISQVFDSMARTKPILTFYGIRRSESNLRSNYKAIADSPKVNRQTVVSPVIDWMDGDIWLYIFTHGLDFNCAYKLGYSRVGCWACPSNSSWSFFLSRIFHSQLAEPWRDYLIEVASSIGKPDPEEYVDSGNWKKRQGGQGLDTAYKGIVTSRPCGDDQNAKTYSLTREITANLYEYFKPFGELDLSRGRSLLGEVFITESKTNSPIMVLQGRSGSKELRVKIISSSNPTLLMQRVDCQIRKYQSCVLCGGCPPVCPVGAISDKSGSYRIDETKCTHCLRCIAHYDTGCLVSKVLRTKKGTI